MGDIETELRRAVAEQDWPLVDELTARLDDADEARERRLRAPSALGSAAAWYASVGISVFPCVAGGKRPATRNGFKDATTDVERVAAWWSATPDANIGLPTGAMFDVVDLDGPAGIVAFHDMLDAGGFDEPILAKARTPHGWHYYVPATGDGNRAGLLTKVDYRGTGGYVLAPPSRLADGSYRWIPGEQLDPARLGAGR